jgi:hypothetical protein
MNGSLPFGVGLLFFYHPQFNNLFSVLNAVNPSETNPYYMFARLDQY